jgi:glycogen operon protein
LRRDYPILRRNRFLTGAYNEALDLKDVTWINATGAEMTDDDWNDVNARCFGMLMDGRAQATGIRRHGSDATLLLVLNAHFDLVRFTLPEPTGAGGWLRIIDTNLPDGGDRTSFKSGDVYDVTARSLLLLQLKPLQ